MRNDIMFSGLVARGEGMAGTMGCPTANIAVEQGTLIPSLGVYVAEATFEGKLYPSLVCINDGRTGQILKMEVHLLGECLELEGKFLEVRLLQKLRSLVPYESHEQMSGAISQDLKNASEYFKLAKNKDV